MTRIYEGNNHILIHAGYRDPVMHSHMAAHIIIARERKLEVTVDGGTFLCQGVCIPSGMAHRIHTNGESVLVFLYDSTTLVSEKIPQICCVPETICDAIIARYSQLEIECTTQSYISFEKDVLQLLGISSVEFGVKDPRIRMAMDYIRCFLSEKITCRNVSEHLGLSESRFSHLFREQTGMTFSAYLIYQRIMYAYTGLLQGKTVTDASLDAGFSSSGHFADVNRRVFGLSASQILKDCVFFKI